MSKMETRLPQLLLAIPMLAALGACATVVPPKTASDVSCSLYRPISYAQMKPGQVDDAGNQADSDATVAAIDQHNAKYDTVCTSPLTPPG